MHKNVLLIEDGANDVIFRTTMENDIYNGMVIELRSPDCKCNAEIGCNCFEGDPIGTGSRPEVFFKFNDPKNIDILIKSFQWLKKQMMPKPGRAKITGSIEK